MYETSQNTPRIRAFLVQLSYPYPPDSTGWRFFALVADADTETVTLYVDGQETMSDSSFTFPMSQGKYPFLVGQADKSDPEGRYKGDIDEIMLFGKALTPAQIAQIYQSQK